MTGEDGKRRTQWLLPDGTLTTDFMEADKAEYGAHRVRLMNQFVGRMKENGLDPTNQEDVQRQALLDAQAPMRKVLGNVWADAEAEDRAADEEYNEQMKEYNKSMRSVFRPLGPDGMPLPNADDNLRDYQRAIQRKETFNLEAIAQKTYEGLPKSYRDTQLRAYQEYFKTHTNELDGRTPEAAALDALKGEVYNAVYQHAVQSLMPKSKTEFFLRKLGDQPFLSTYQAMDMGASALTGSWGMTIADQAAMAQYGQQHRALYITGTVLNMAIDPTTYMAGGVGSVAGKQALRLTGRQMLKGATKEMAERYAAGTLTGRLVQGVTGGAFNFATFETAKNIQQQASTGGMPDYETGTSDGFSGQEVLNAAKHGFIMGSATGALSPLIGNVADKAVKATTSTAGKVGVRGTELAVSTLAEGTVFSIPEWIEGDRDAMDVWSDNMAMMLGFKASHAVKTAPSVIRSLRPAAPEGRPLTREERIHNNKSFNERVRERLNASPSDIGLTAEERAELRKHGYGDLSDLFTFDPEHRSRKAETAHTIEGEAKGITGLSTRVDYEPRPDESGSRDFDGYEAMERLMEDPGVSEATRAKAYYILTGRMLPMSTVTG